ncbi:ThiF family adenylyltransferase [Nocardioides sp. MH1]|uniref:ThiF family adenylyltransferase n=1 Tax=Nocardioides sp. MH1 TaxID=3242490 RepID=UPI00351FBB62
MSLPSFFSRVADAIRPVAEVDPATLAAKLDGVRVHLHLATDDPAARRAFSLAANLAARIYPHIHLSADCHDATKEEEQARGLVRRINPLADVQIINRAGSPASMTPDRGRGDVSVRLTFGVADRPPEPARGSSPGGSCEGSEITVSAAGWAVYVDPAVARSLDQPFGDHPPGHPLAWLATAAFGMGEVFRYVFADELGERGRRQRQPGSIDLLTAQSPAGRPAEFSGGALLDIGHVHLAGAGAIGQATVYALASLPATGTLHVVDPETVTLSNLQRYVLTDSSSVGAFKVELVEKAFTDLPLNVDPFRGKWGEQYNHLHAPRVLVALDSPQDRVGVAATLPRHAYNAWTQVHDLGWSRHELFGAQPCLACLYLPSRELPSEHELIATALDQEPLRILGYLLSPGVPIGLPLPVLPGLPAMPNPKEAQRWLEVSLMADLVTAGVVHAGEESHWAQRTVGSLYRDGVCAGGLLPVGGLSEDVVVPLAHQSVLAGVMLAAELIWASDVALAERRDQSTEHRFDVLRGFPQVVARPRQPTAHCLCSDAAYLESSAAVTPSGSRE